MNSIDVKGASGGGNNANGVGVKEALKKAEAKVAELTAKLKEAGLGS